MAVIQIDIRKQPRSVLRVLEEFERRSALAVSEHGKLGLHQDGLPIVVVSVHHLFPKMRLKRRLALASRVFAVIENMHRLAFEKPPTDTRQ